MKLKSYKKSALLVMFAFIAMFFACRSKTNVYLSNGTSYQVIESFNKDNNLIYAHNKQLYYSERFLPDPLKGYDKEEMFYYPNGKIMEYRYLSGEDVLYSCKYDSEGGVHSAVGDVLLCRDTTAVKRMDGSISYSGKLWFITPPDCQIKVGYNPKTEAEFCEVTQGVTCYNYLCDNQSKTEIEIHYTVFNNNGDKETSYIYSENLLYSGKCKANKVSNASVVSIL